MDPSEVSRFATYVRERIALAKIALGPEYFYASLSLCIIDAVYSIGVRYEGVRNVILRYCARFQLAPFRDSPEVQEAAASRETLSMFIARYEALGIEGMARDAFRNLQRTSTRNGILKADAALRFARVLRDAGIEDFDTAVAHTDDPELDARLRNIPGQDFSVSHFWLLAGSDQIVKPDRIVQRFAAEALGRVLPAPELRLLVAATAQSLMSVREDLTPRLLNHAVRRHQRHAEALRRAISAAGTRRSRDTPAPGVAESAPTYEVDVARRVSVTEYLALEDAAAWRSEYVAGEVFSMAGVSLRHNLLSGWLYQRISAHIDGGETCRAFISDVRVRLCVGDEEIFYYPDVMVACEPGDLSAREVRHPRLVIEVLSASTESIDRREKALNYRSIETLEEYVLVAQRQMEITILRRADNWDRAVICRPGGVVELRSIGLSFEIGELYASALASDVSSR